MKNDLWTARRWLARLSFSFLIVGLWLAWTAYRHVPGDGFSRGRAALCYVAAFMCFSLFLMGTRERHRDKD